MSRAGHNRKPVAADPVLLSVSKTTLADLVWKLASDPGLPSHLQGKTCGEAIREACKDLEIPNAGANRLAVIP